jgi:hypothetical protein
MNPYLIIAVCIAWGASVGGAFVYGTDVGHDSEIASQAKINKAITETREAAQQGAANAIAQLKPINRTIVQKTEREVRENIRYSECVNTDGQLRNINAAIAGRAPDPAGGGSVPAAK